MPRTGRSSAPFALAVDLVLSEGDVGQMDLNIRLPGRQSNVLVRRPLNAHGQLESVQHQSAAP